MKHLFKLFILLSVVLTSSCSSKNSSELVIYGLQGPSSVGMAQLFANTETANSLIRAEIAPTVDIMVAKFAAGQAQAGILPPNVAAKLASSGVDIQVAAIVGRGMLSILGTDSAIAGPADLGGKQIYVAGGGSTPDYVTKRILQGAGLDIGGDINLDFTLPYPEIAQSLLANRISLAVLPEPFATMVLSGNSSIKELFNMQEAWTEATGLPDYPMTLLVLSRPWASANRAEVKALLAAYKNSVDWVLENPNEAAKVAEEAGLGVKAAAIARAIPRTAYCFVPAKEGRSELEGLFKVFMDFDPKSIGQAMPAKAFYWE